MVMLGLRGWLGLSYKVLLFPQFERRIEMAVEHVPDLRCQPGRVRDDEDEAELVVGQEDGVVIAVLQRDAFPPLIEIQQGGVIPDIRQRTDEVAFLDEHDPAFGVGVIGTFGRVIRRDGQVDEGLDDGEGGMCGGQLGQIGGMLEVQHDGSPVWLGQKKTRRGRCRGGLRGRLLGG